MKRIRLTRISVIEYTPEPSCYPEGSTIEEMAQIDASNDDIDLTFSGELEDERVLWEIIEE